MVTFFELMHDFQWLSLYLLGFFTLIILFFQWFFFSRVAFRKIKTGKGEDRQQPVSVVICAKNEYENLKKNLPAVLEQDYPEFEVVLVNDFSEDDSYFLLKSFQEKYSHFKVVNLRDNVNFFAGKKLALAVGIKSAKYDTVLLTDADCAPVSKNWISSVCSGFDDSAEIVLGYGGYRKLPGFLNSLIRFDTLTIAIQYMGFALAGFPYMGVGRNLAYHRALFYRQGGFASHYKISSGDDDLFINKAATAKNTRVALHPDSFTISEPKRNFTSWFKQKKRHLSTGTYYRAGNKLALGLLTLSSTLFYPALVVFIIFNTQPSLPLYIGGGLVLIKVFSQMLLYYYAGKKLGEKKLFLYSPLFDMIFAFLNPVFAISNLFYRKNTWK